MFLKKREILDIPGALFFMETRQEHHLLCTKQCPTVVRDVSILLSTFLCLFFSNSSKSTCSRKKKQDGIPFLVFPPPHMFIPRPMPPYTHLN